MMGRVLTVLMAIALGRTAAANTTVTEFADVVLVGDAERFFCSGVVVRANIVITAKHCAHATRIGLGHSIDAVRSIAIERVTTHPTEDIAVATLVRNVNVLPHPVRLHSHTPPTARIAIVGFGVRDPVRVAGFGTRRLREILTDGWGCDTRRSVELGCRPTELLLRGGRDNDTCFGDSGGGAFEYTPAGWRLIGITSRGTVPKRVICGEGGVYVRTDAVARWLREQGVQ